MLRPNITDYLHELIQSTTFRIYEAVCLVCLFIGWFDVWMWCYCYI